MPQHFFCALALTVTLTTNLTPMTRDNDHRDGSKLTLPRFDPKDPTFFDDLQAYAQDRGLGWLLHADGEDTSPRHSTGRSSCHYARISCHDFTGPRLHAKRSASTHDMRGGSDRWQRHPDCKTSKVRLCSSCWFDRRRSQIERYRTAVSLWGSVEYCTSSTPFP